MQTFTVTASDEAGAVLAGLTEILQAARGEIVGLDPGADTIAVPVRGQGATLGAVFAELARDLLAQYDAQGSGLDRFRLDGLLRGEDGYVGWGYLEGTATGDGAPARIDLSGEPKIDRTDAGIELTFEVVTT
jgi:hypothetical protein